MIIFVLQNVNVNDYDKNSMRKYSKKEDIYIQVASPRVELGFSPC